MANEKLNQKQLAFANFYLTSGNGMQAYMKSYGIKDENVAKVNASRLLTNANIVNYLEAMRAKTDKRVIASVSELQELLTNIVYKEDVINEEGNVIDKLSYKDRLKAVDMLIHSQGGYKDNLSVGSETISAIKIKFVDKSASNLKKEKDPKICGDYTPPTNTKE